MSIHYFKAAQDTTVETSSMHVVERTWRTSSRYHLCIRAEERRNADGVMVECHMHWALFNKDILNDRYLIDGYRRGLPRTIAQYSTYGYPRARASCCAALLVFGKDLLYPSATFWCKVQWHGPKQGDSGTHQDIMVGVLHLPRKLDAFQEYLPHNFQRLNPEHRVLNKN
ncbi:hypothetical protein BDZ97DRAFT_1759268 [Flammula alnicola]|nr:hypothetical protein BDZ97DRAFT_1759268 [Flammula alnicola]